MSPVAGVDGGGTRTRALILADDGTELGRGEGPAGIVTSIEPAASSGVRAVVTAVTAAAREANVELPLEHLFCGLAGVESAGTVTVVRAALEGIRIAARVTVTTDVDVAFHDAFVDGESGILLVAGTGSVAMGRDADGHIVRAGGWGALLDDSGSGYRIGLEALRLVLRAHDGRAPETRLTPPLLAATGVSRPEELVAVAGRMSKGRIAGLAPTVLQLSDEGDPAAEVIVERAVHELIALAEAVAGRLSPEDSPSAAFRPPVALIGGLFARGGSFQRRVVAALQDGGFPLQEGTVDGARGAAGMALKSSRKESFLSSPPE